MREIAFAGSVPEHYDVGLGPVLFEPHAEESAARLAEGMGRDWLEVAAGTGRLTRHLLRALPRTGRLVATDLQPSMLDVAKSTLEDGRVHFEAADALALPFEDDAFDVVASQFGVMFYPDRRAGHAEARRVLRPGGTYLFTTWASPKNNPWALEVQELIDESFSADAPGFFRVPFSMGEPDLIEPYLRAAGFSDVRIDKVVKPLETGEARAFARGAVAGTPLGTEIQNRGGDLEAAIDRLTERFVRRFGDRPLKSHSTALYVTARKEE